MMEYKEHIKDILVNLPERPGVYLMKDREGEILYIGKAISLKNRVRSYFGSLKGQAPKVAAMVEKVRDIDYIIVSGEMEALVLENNLIKAHQPFYNILLKDDKQYPYVRIDLGEPFPRIEVVRKVEKDGAKYYGPYHNATMMREVLDAVGTNFKLRTCKRDIARSLERRERPCLNYQIGRCSGPCGGHITSDGYHRIVGQVIDLLQGKSDFVEGELRKRMQEASDRLDFELAAELRDQLHKVRWVVERQRADFASLEERDAFSVAMYKGDAMVQMMNIRDGKLVNSQTFFVGNAEEGEEEVLFSLIKQYYADIGHIPGEVLLPFQHQEIPLIEDWLTGLRSHKVHVFVPQRGEKKRLVELCAANARDGLLRREAQLKREWDRGEGALLELQSVLGLSVVPRRMECYDISHTQGVYTVASMVVYAGGKPDKSAYRRFRIRTVEGIDDFRSMKEVVLRRLLRAMEPDEKSRNAFGELPDLIVIDGGKGQLSSGLAAMEEAGFAIPMISLAERIEEIFLPGESHPIVLKSNSPALHILQGIRDEAHRFAITYHRSLRANASLVSELDAIRGIGKKRKQALLIQYKTIAQMKNAGVEELRAVRGMTQAAAQTVYDYFHWAMQDAATGEPEK